MTKDELSAALLAALERFRIADAHLIEVWAHERSMTHKIAVHLSDAIRGSGYDVDCEYDRDKIAKKKSAGYDVYPDIIVHKRGSSEDNLLVIEVKKQGETDDYEKLRGYKRLPLKYAYAVHVYIMNDGECKVEWVS